MKLIRKKVSLPVLLLGMVIAFLAAYSLPKRKVKVVGVPSEINCPGTMQQIRTTDYELVHPLLLTDIPTESASLQNIRSKIETYISTVKRSGNAEQVSVYFRSLDDGAWFATNPNETYNPASMSKIIYLLVYLKEAESNPNVLNKKIFFGKHFTGGNKPNIVEFSLQENSYYTVKDLFTYMIMYSDNDAALLLSQNMNLSIYNKLFKDLNIPIPEAYSEYFITALDYSKFFRILYNATYIRPELSEFGLKILTTSTFKRGILNGIGENIPVAHKFGERIIAGKAQLHEFGIVFVKGKPYLLGVMTKGSSLDQLSDVIAEIARIAHQEYKSFYTNS